MENKPWILLSEEIHNIAKNQCSDSTSRISICVGCLNKFIIEKQIKELIDYCDWLEKSNYDFFETVQSHLSSRIVELKSIINPVEPIDQYQADPNII